MAAVGDAQGREVDLRRQIRYPPPLLPPLAYFPRPARPPAPVLPSHRMAMRLVCAEDEITKQLKH
eukprot:COSAG04_NODE_18585_length_437_cov_4.204142_1_plen_64_part_10